MMNLNELLKVGITEMELVKVLKTLGKYSKGLLDISFDGCPNFVEYGFRLKDGYGCIHLYPDEKCLEDEKRLNRLINALRIGDWKDVPKYVEKFYVLVCNNEGKEVLGYKDFGISTEEFFRLSDRA